MTIRRRITDTSYLAVWEAYLTGALHVQEETVHRAAQPEEFQPAPPELPLTINFTTGIIRARLALVGQRAWPTPTWPRHRRLGFNVDEVRRAFIQRVRKAGAGN